MSSMDFPALAGGVVTEAHARVCVERGHATHTVDGVPSAHCPRCGELVDETADDLAAEVFERARAEGMDHREAAARAFAARLRPERR